MITRLTQMNIKSLLFIFITVILSFNLKAQTGNATDYLKHSMPQPEAMCLINQMNLSNSLHTGAVNTSIPLYNIQGDMLDLPISLSYISNGIKVTEEASRVGLGWKLNAGGRVTRVIRGIEDEHFSSTLMPITILPTPNTNADRSPPTSEFPNYTGDIDNTQIIIEGHLHNVTLPDDISKFDIVYDKVSKDLPDLFYYSVGDLSGKFTINKDHSVNQMPYNNVDITPILGSDDIDEFITELPSFDGIPDLPDLPDIPEDNEDRIIGFKIQDETGREFIFNDVELSDNIEWSPLFDNNFDIPTDLYGKRATSWNISEIRQVANGETINFTYLDRFSIDNKITTNHRIVTGDDCLCKQPTANTSSGSFRNTKILQSISWRHGQIDFLSAYRGDIAFDSHYTRIDIKLNTVDNPITTSTIKSYIFNTSFFNNNASYSSKRLKLTGLQELGSDGTSNDKPAYVFTYKEDLDLPEKDSNERDLWGYYDGEGFNSNTLNFFKASNEGKDEVSVINPAGGTTEERTLSDLDHAMAGILHEITNPTGGKTKFDYELNRFNYFDNEYLGAGLRVKSKTLVANEDETNNIIYNYGSTTILMETG